MLEVIITVIAIVLLILPVIDWFTAYLLQKTFVRAKTSVSLNERRKVAIILAISTTINALIAANRLFTLMINPAILVLGLGVSLILTSVPNTYWLSLLIRGKLHGQRKEDD